MKKINVCLITPGHLASNPRLVKEAMALSKAGMRVHVIFTQYTSYLSAHDQRILQGNPGWSFDCLDWTKSSFRGRLTRLLSALRQKTTKNATTALNRNFTWQLRKAILYRADLYIAHNLGALPVAVQAAERTGAKSGFDAEDVYRYQLTDNNDDPRVTAVAEAERKYIPRLAYLTAAGRPIGHWYEQHFRRPVTSIQNVFPKTPATLFRPGAGGPLRLFWFSQTIGPNRGLETVLEAIGLSDVPVVLHLLGEVSASYHEHLDQLAAGKASGCTISYHATIYPDEIFELCAKFEIGLAAEPGFSENNRRALSNKLFTYIQCGLFIAASATPAQEMFIKNYPATGKVYHDAAGLAEILSWCYLNRHSLTEQRKTSFALGQQELYWEKEEQQFLDVIRRAVHA